MSKEHRIVRLGIALLLLVLAFWAEAALAEVSEVRLARQIGLAYLPLMVMEEQNLIEKRAQAVGLGHPKVEWSQFSGANAMNDALLSGNLEFASVGAAPLSVLWARTKGTSNEIKGVAAYCSFPLYLDTRDPNVHSLRDFTEKDKIALPAVKVSGQALILEMATAHEFGNSDYDKLDSLTVSQGHADALIQMLSGHSQINSHFSSAPFHQQEMKDPAIHTVLKSYDVVGGRQTAILLATSATFRSENPKTYGAVLGALSQAIEFINGNKADAANLYLRLSHDKRNSPKEILEMLQDPDFAFTLVPERVLAISNFLYQIGSIKVKPQTWKDLFFSDIYNLAGS